MCVYMCAFKKHGRMCVCLCASLFFMCSVSLCCVTAEHQAHSLLSQSTLEKYS